MLFSGAADRRAHRFPRNDQERGDDRRQEQESGGDFGPTNSAPVLLERVELFW